MRVVFMGTPGVAVPALEAVLASSHEVVGVVTQPDRPRGRGRQVSASPVKSVAERTGIATLQPETPKAPGFAEDLARLEPDALAVVAYGHILPPPVLEVAPAMNVHFSLLPAYRGAAPVQRALMDGVDETGVSVFLLEPTIDTGPVVAVGRVPVTPMATAGEVFESLMPLGARLLIEALDGLEAGTLTPQPQDDAEASPAPKITAEDARVEWSAPATAIKDLVRALNPRPGAYTHFRGKRLRIWSASVVDAEGEPGSLLEVDGMPVVAAGAEAVALHEVQPEGKKRMSGPDFARGYRPTEGERLG